MDHSAPFSAYIPAACFALLTAAAGAMPTPPKPPARGGSRFPAPSARKRTPPPAPGCRRRCSAYFRFATKPGADAKRIFNLAQTSVIIISGTITILLIAFATPISTSLQISNPQFVTWLALTMLVDALVAIPFARLRLEKKPLLFGSAKIFNVLVLVALNYYFHKINFNPEVGIGYVFLANLLANAFFLLFFIKTLFSWRPVWDKSLSPQMFH